MSRAERIELSGSFSFSTTSCTFFFPSIRSFNEHAVGSLVSSSSSSSPSASSSASPFASSSAWILARSASSFRFRAAAAISFLFFWIHLSIQSLATTSGATLITFFPLPRTISDPIFEKPTLFSTAKALGLFPIFAAMSLFSRFTLRYFCSYGSLTILFMKVLKRPAAPSTSATESSLTRSSSLVVIRSVRRSLAEKEKQAAPAVLTSLAVNSLYFLDSSAVTGGLNGAAPNRPIIKFFIISSDRGIPWNMCTILPSRTPNTVGRAVTSKAPLTGRSLSELTFTNLKAPPALTAISSRAGPSTLHGPHQSA
mmetsp:Transcript_111415/g.322102  ORF Transcript_111415/g.322102 Transcript_111415/m.322102 type:complete len:311 (-) Transcript_111415:281-1213(-)